MDKVLKFIGGAVLALLLVFAFSFLGAFLVRWLVNSTFTETALFVLFGVPKIGYWLAYKISLLTGLLLKSRK